jgi:hypothetical protein
MHAFLVVTRQANQLASGFALLFFGLRGGKGMLGIVTAIAYREPGGMSRVVPSPKTGLPTWV